MRPGPESLWGLLAPPMALRRALWGLPALVAIFSRLPALAGRWVWDDLLIVHDQLGAFHSIREVFFPPEGIPSFSVHYYRPLTTASFLLDRFLYGDRPLGFHLTVLAGHAAAATLLFFLARSFFRGADGDGPALGASLLFAAHPVLTESVAWVAGRADILATTFLLGAALVLRRRPLGNGSIAAAVVLFSAACLFKEVAYAFLPLVPFFAADPGVTPGVPTRLTRSTARGSTVRGRFSGARGSAHGEVVPGSEGQRSTPARRTRGATPRVGRKRDVEAASGSSGRPVAAVVSLALAAGVLLFLRAQVLGGGMGGEWPHTGPVAAALGIGGALAFYLPRVLVPLPPMPFVEAVPSGAAAWSGLLAAFALATAGVLLFRRAASRLVGIGLLSFLALLAPSLLPAVSIVGSVPLAERYLYAPVAGLSLAVVGAIPLVPRSWRRGTGVTLLAAVVLFGAISFSRSTIWADDIAFWTAASRGARSPFSRIQLAIALSDAGRIDEAQEIYERLLSTGARLNARQRARIEMSLGVLMSRRGRSAEALRLFEESVRLDPDSALAWYNLASVLWQQALVDGGKGVVDRPAAERCAQAVRRAHDLSRLDPRILLLLGRVEAALGRSAEAREALRQAAEIDPRGPSGGEARQALEDMSLP